MSEIPEDIMDAARKVAMKIAAVLPVTGSEDVNHIAKAIFAERERCAWIAEQYPAFFPFDEIEHAGSGIILSAQCESSDDIAKFIRDPEVSKPHEPVTPPEQGS